MSKWNNDNKGIKGYVIALLFGGVLALSLVAWYLIDLFIQNPQGQGVFGDKFGAINALFSGLAFAGLIITLILQKKDLGLQRDELEQTREELKNQCLEFETQNKTLKQQQFESALYNMLQLQQQIVNDLAYDTAVEGYSDTTARNGWTSGGADFGSGIDIWQRHNHSSNFASLQGGGYGTYQEHRPLGGSSDAASAYESYRHLYGIEGVC